jgi:hypothetical protein
MQTVCIMDALPIPDQLEPVLLTAYSVTSGSQIVNPYAIDVVVIVPSGTVATVNLGGTSFDSSQTVQLNANNRPMANTITISRASGSGTITVLVSRVANRATNDA